MAANSAVSGETYEILDGVRRAKAAETAGHGTIPARIDDGSGALGPVIDLPIDSLRSPKDVIDVSSVAKFRRYKESLDKARQQSAPPPIMVIRDTEEGALAMLDSNSDTARSARALQRVLTKARYLAQTNCVEQLTGVLDWAELLADDIATTENRSRQFSEHLEGLGDDHPEFAGVFRDYQDGLV